MFGSKKTGRKSSDSAKEQQMPQMTHDIIDIIHNGQLTDFEICTVSEYENNDFEMSLTDIPSKYLNDYTELQARQCYVKQLTDYTVEEDDTIYGIELKFNLSRHDILEHNSINENSIYPGMVIKIPVLKAYNPEKEGLPLLQHQSSFLGVNLMDEIMKTTFCKRWNVFYVTEIGNIEGELALNEDVIFFDPALKESNNILLQKANGKKIVSLCFWLEKSILKFSMFVQIKDVNLVNPIELPTRISMTKEETNTDILLQIKLYRIGKSEFEKKYKKKLDQYRKVKKAIASAFFRIVDHEQILSPQEQSMKINEIKAEIQAKLDLIAFKKEEESKDSSQEEELTNVPYFDIVPEDVLKDKVLVQSLIERTNKIWGGADAIPKMLEKSKIIGDDQFLQIISHMPSIFRIANWNLVYSSWKHGSSLFTLLRQSENYSPAVLIVKDLDNYVFGGYLSEGLKMTSGHFYGSGETFLFTFLDQKKCILYRWTQINNHFVLSDSDGIAVGCGDKYGLFLNQELSGGYSTTCETFANDQLSKNLEFVIDQIEVWAIDL